ncbi:hypothetical protein D187_008100 [Cystobacter fuscus DSM 2262]|uniref:Uncharacterized protein n=1 Tax=Cystobacter fuscus (strain ATCC 25194 / DSM 2262 / NBRC 100088 / M29) TaxID=1242864 RepID=S9QJV4_CYSF2|nr:hypothetical protein D187_008100 [Cystobacter fuscus DSM 2262]
MPELVMGVVDRRERGSLGEIDADHLREVVVRVGDRPVGGRGPVECHAHRGEVPVVVVAEHLGDRDVPVVPGIVRHRAPFPADEGGLVPIAVVAHRDRDRGALGRPVGLVRAQAQRRGLPRRRDGAFLHHAPERVVLVVDEPLLARIHRGLHEAQPPGHVRHEPRLPRVGIGKGLGALEGVRGHPLCVGARGLLGPAHQRVGERGLERGHGPGHARRVGPVARGARDLLPHVRHVGARHGLAELIGQAHGPRLDRARERVLEVLAGREARRRVRAETQPSGLALPLGHREIDRIGLARVALLDRLLPGRGLVARALVGVALVVRAHDAVLGLPPVVVGDVALELPGGGEIREEVLHVHEAGPVLQDGLVLAGAERAGGALRRHELAVERVIDEADHDAIGAMELLHLTLTAGGVVVGHADADALEDGEVADGALPGERDGHGVPNRADRLTVEELASGEEEHDAIADDEEPVLLEGRCGQRRPGHARLGRRPAALPADRHVAHGHGCDHVARLELEVDRAGPLRGASPGDGPRGGSRVHEGSVRGRPPGGRVPALAPAVAVTEGLEHAADGGVQGDLGVGARWREDAVVAPAREEALGEFLDLPGGTHRDGRLEGAVIVRARGAAARVLTGRDLLARLVEGAAHEAVGQGAHQHAVDGHRAGGGVRDRQGERHRRLRGGGAGREWGTAGHAGPRLARTGGEAGAAGRGAPIGRGNGAPEHLGAAERDGHGDVAPRAVRGGQRHEDRRGGHAVDGDGRGDAGGGVGGEAGWCPHPHPDEVRALGRLGRHRHGEGGVGAAGQPGRADARARVVRLILHAGERPAGGVLVGLEAEEGEPAERHVGRACHGELAVGAVDRGGRHAEAVHALLLLAIGRALRGARREGPSGRVVSRCVGGERERHVRRVEQAEARLGHGDEHPLGVRPAGIGRRHDLHGDRARVGRDRVGLLRGVGERVDRGQTGIDRDALDRGSHERLRLALAPILPERDGHRLARRGAGRALRYVHGGLRVGDTVDDLRVHRLHHPTAAEHEGLGFEHVGGDLLVDDPGGLGALEQHAVAVARLRAQQEAVEHVVVVVAGLIRHAVEVGAVHPPVHGVRRIRCSRAGAGGEVLHDVAQGVAARGARVEDVARRELVLIAVGDVEAGDRVVLDGTGEGVPGVLVEVHRRRRIEADGVPGVGGEELRPLGRGARALPADHLLLEERLELAHLPVSQHDRLDPLRRAPLLGGERQEGRPLVHERLGVEVVALRAHEGIQVGCRRRGHDGTPVRRGATEVHVWADDRPVGTAARGPVVRPIILGRQRLAQRGRGRPPTPRRVIGHHLPDGLADASGGNDDLEGVVGPERVALIATRVGHARVERRAHRPRRAIEAREVAVDGDERVVDHLRNPRGGRVARPEGVGELAELVDLERVGRRPLRHPDAVGVLLIVAPGQVGHRHERGARHEGDTVQVHRRKPGERGRGPRLPHEQTVQPAERQLAVEIQRGEVLPPARDPCVAGGRDRLARPRPRGPSPGEQIVAAGQGPAAHLRHGEPGGAAHEGRGGAGRRPREGGDVLRGGDPVEGGAAPLAGPRHVTVEDVDGALRRGGAREGEREEVLIGDGLEAVEIEAARVEEGVVRVELPCEPRPRPGPDLE